MENVCTVTSRIYESLQDKYIEGDFGSIPIQCSMGVCGLKIQNLELDNTLQSIPQTYIDEIANQLIDGADKMLYQAKNKGRSCVVTGEYINWLTSPK